MNDMDRAKALFRTGNYTCVLVNADSVYTSTLSGVAPMIDFISSGTDLQGFSAADKIVGKAAAMLFVLAGVKAIYSPIMSEKAVNVFFEYGVSPFYDTLTSAIINREGTGLCPMDQAVKDIDDPHIAFLAIKQTLDLLKTKSGNNGGK